MAADIVPIRLGLTKGDLYTLWAPRWRDSGDEWEALLGKDEDLYGFESVADLVYAPGYDPETGETTPSSGRIATTTSPTTRHGTA